MGSYYGYQCHVDIEDAELRAYGSVQPIITTGGDLVSVQYRLGSWSVVTVRDGAEVGILQAPSLTFPECNPVESALDGITLGFLVLAVWAVAWGFNITRRVL